MLIKVYSSYYDEAYNLTVDLIKESGHELLNGSGKPDMAICPDYDKLIPAGELDIYPLGVLVFHPSPLPRMRGKDAIKRQYKAGDKAGGATWFWATNGIDNGDICEQEVLLINSEIRPRDYYKYSVLPAMLRTLKRALTGIGKGEARYVPQPPDVYDIIKNYGTS